MNEERRTIPGTGLVVSPTSTAPSAADILAARARQLAREATTTAGDDSTFIEVLAFTLAKETYAFELTHIHKVEVLAEVTALPGVPPYVLGVISMHGHIIAVVDLRKILGLAGSAQENSRQAIILRSDHMEFAVRADRVTGVRRIPRAGVLTSLPTLTDVRAAYLEGVTQDGTVILSAAKLLADPHLVVNHTI